MFKIVFVTIFSKLMLAEGAYHTRVFGGAPTSIEQYPILAQLLLDSLGNQQYSQNCAGVILTARHIISTAHCYQYNANTGKNYTLPEFWKIRVGSTYRNRGGSVFNVKVIVLHYAFDKTYHDNDVAVVVATKKFTFSNYVRQGTIPNQGTEIKAKSVGTLVGWGTTERGKEQPDQLQYVNMLTIDQRTCQKRYDNITARITEGMLCAGRLDEGGVDGCYGDSGGPLIYKGVVVGLMSFGYVCGHYYFPGVYTKVAHYSNWIVNIVYST